MRVIELGGERYDVLEEAERGLPVRVRATLPWRRGTMAEAFANLALARYRLLLELWAALPFGAGRWVGRPREPWVEIRWDSGVRSRSMR